MIIGDFKPDGTLKSYEYEFSKDTHLQVSDNTRNEFLLYVNFKKSEEILAELKKLNEPK